MTTNRGVCIDGKERGRCYSVLEGKERFRGTIKVEEDKHMTQVRKKLGCSYHQIGGIFLCEKTGREHRCGPRCDARILIDDTYVCGISGITSMDDNGTTIAEEERCSRISWGNRR